VPAKEKSLKDLYERPGFMLRRAHQISVSLFLAEVQDVEVTTTQYGVLVILQKRENLDQIGLSKLVGLDRSTTALVVGHRKMLRPSPLGRLLRTHHQIAADPCRNSGIGFFDRRYKHPPRQNPPGRDLAGDSAVGTSRASAMSPKPHTRAQSCNRRYSLPQPADSQTAAGRCDAAWCERCDRSQAPHRYRQYAAPASVIPTPRDDDIPVAPNIAASWKWYCDEPQTAAPPPGGSAHQSSRHAGRHHKVPLQTSFQPINASQRHPSA
jgi:hypothetical protein